MATLTTAFPNKRIVETILCFYVLVFCFLPTVLCAGHLKKLYLPDPGPESFAFDLAGGGPYTSVADGRVLKYEGPKVGFVEYGYTKADRPRKFCDGTNRTDISQICGRPTGLGFYYKTGELYLADGGLGLVVIGAKGGPGRRLASAAGGLRFGFPDGLEVDQRTGIVYFTDASSRYNISQIAEIVANRDQTGRLLKYDPRTKKVTVLLRGLAGAAGVAISQDGSYLLVTEFVKARVSKYWLKGPLAHTSHVIANLSGAPDKIKRNSAGDYWIAVTVQSQKPTPTLQLQGQKINGNGKILETITFSPGFNSSLITEVQEYKRKLYLGSIYIGYVGVYRKH
ncbi:protein STRICTOSIDINE SYNTHASE-LIKE 11-like [Coffea arabica]|uniref:Protein STRICTOSIDINE SYNTHASE-LIKE 11-like n=1 Tax=Coffea arabica TaxID=13443 RepID=A0A6P6XB53_COFAR|nr:protein STRICTOSIDINE SYNTHASE-LIKE 11-like isoform X1 [Coffea arabica]